MQTKVTFYRTLGFTCLSLWLGIWLFAYMLYSGAMKDAGHLIHIYSALFASCILGQPFLLSGAVLLYRADKNMLPPKKSFWIKFYAIVMLVVIAGYVFGSFATPPAKPPFHKQFFTPSTEQKLTAVVDLLLKNPKDPKAQEILRSINEFLWVQEADPSTQSVVLAYTVRPHSCRYFFAPNGLPSKLSKDGMIQLSADWYFDQCMNSE